MLSGTITALITPFKDGELDDAGLRENIRFQVEGGVDGILVLGTTGEAPTLTEAERKTVIQIAVDEAQDKTLVMAGTGTWSTQETIVRTRQAQELGVDMALVVTPYYNRPMQEGIYQHCVAVHDAVHMPICLYNIPKRTGTNMEVATVRRLAELERIVGIKEASGSLAQVQEVIEQTIDCDFVVMSGDDPLTIPIMGLGGRGVISATSNLIPELIADMVDMMLSDEEETAIEVSNRLEPLFEVLSLETNPICVKAAMELRGLAAGECRLPLTPLSSTNHKKLRTALKREGLLTRTIL